MPYIGRPAIPVYCILVFASIYICIYIYLDNILHRGCAIHGDPCKPPNEKLQYDYCNNFDLFGI